MNKRLFDKRCHYSIRKFAIGAASVMIGASIFGISAVQAEEVDSSNAKTEETTVHQEVFCSLKSSFLFLDTK